MHSITTGWENWALSQKAFCSRLRQQYKHQGISHAIHGTSQRALAFRVYFTQTSKTYDAVLMENEFGRQEAEYLILLRITTESNGAIGWLIMHRHYYGLKRSALFGWCIVICMQSKILKLSKLMGEAKVRVHYLNHRTCSSCFFKRCENLVHCLNCRASPVTTVQ